MLNLMTRRQIDRNVYVRLNAMKRVSTEQCSTNAMTNAVLLTIVKIVLIVLFKKPQFDMLITTPALVDSKSSTYFIHTIFKLTYTRLGIEGSDCVHCEIFSPIRLSWNTAVKSSPLRNANIGWSPCMQAGVTT